MAPPDPIKIDTVKNGILPHRLSVSDVLRANDKEFVLFTPALLFTHGGFDRDPVVEFASYYSEVSSVRPACIDLQKDQEFFFRGLGVRPAPKTKTLVNWDKRLYAIPGKAAADCFSFLAGINWTQPATGFFAHAFSYTVDMLDPTAHQPTLLSVTVFGVAANEFVAFLDAGKTPPTVRFIRTATPHGTLQQFGLSASRTEIINPFEV